MFKLTIFLLLLLYFVSKNESARILGIFSMPSPSHQMIYGSLCKALAAQGHNVTVVSPYPLKNKVKNYRDIYLPESHQFKKDYMEQLMQPNTTKLSWFTNGFAMFSVLPRLILQNPEVQALKKEQFDLLLLFPITMEPYLGLAHHFKAPVVLVNTIGSIPPVNQIFGNPAPPSWVPIINVDLSSNTNPTYFDRLKNTLSSIFFNVILLPLTNSVSSNILKELFPEAPSLEELIQEHVAIVLLNSHFSIENSRPHLPNMIQVGGLQIEDPKPLPKDLQQYLDEAKDGAIFFSLGSNVKIADMKKETFDAIFKVLGGLKQKVLFKSEVDIPNLPKNIKLGKWFPQNDVLAHKNVKLFISHGGLLSTTEAVYHGVPIIGFPHFGDQRNNMKTASSSGYAVHLELDDLNEKTFQAAIDSIFNDTKIRDNIKLRSSLFRNQPMKPLDTALYWVNHVIQYKGAKHLQATGAKLPLYQYVGLDVIPVIFIGFVIAVYILYKILRLIIYVIKKLIFYLIRKLCVYLFKKMFVREKSKNE